MSASFFATIGSFVFCLLAYQIQLDNEYLISIYAETYLMQEDILYNKSFRPILTLKIESLNVYCKPASGYFAVYSSLSNL